MALHFFGRRLLTSRPSLTRCYSLTAASSDYGAEHPSRLMYPRFALDPARHGTWTTVKGVQQRASALAEGEKAQNTTLTLTGRIHAKRESSAKLVFYDVVQNGEMIQVVASRGQFLGNSFTEDNHALARGDIASFTGIPGKTKKGQPSLFVTNEMCVLTPCLRSIPSRSGLKDPEKRFRQRHLDLIVNPEAAKILRIRSEIIRSIRRFFDDRGYLEVETPILASKAGGANARPFMTRANALDIDMQLRIAPELYLKQLVIGGLDRVYEIGKQFRNEGIDANHNPEFTTCEFYQAYGNLESLMSDTETLLSVLADTIQTQFSTGPSDIRFDQPFQRINVIDHLESATRASVAEILKSKEAPHELASLCRSHGIYISGPLTEARLLDKLISHFIEPECHQPTFLYNHPLSLSPLAKDSVDDKGRHVAARFELFIRGKEIVNAYEELNDPKEQRRRFELQVLDRDLGDLEAPIPDMAYCEAMEYGLPPTAGWGMGIDRVVQLLSGATHIREVLAFPVMRSATDPA